MTAEPAVQRRPRLSVGGVLIGLGVLALAAIIAFIVVSAQRDQALRSDAVSSAASSLAASSPAHN